MIKKNRILKNVKKKKGGEQMNETLLSPHVDFVFKNIFGNAKHPLVLVSLLNAILQSEDPIKSVTFLDRTLERQFLEDKGGVLDVLAETDKGETVNVEIQLNGDESMKVRSCFYMSRLYTQNIKEGDTYKKLRRTVCINLINYNMFKDEDYHRSFVMYDKEHQEQLTDHLEIHFIELKKAQDIPNISEVNNQLEAWMQFINSPESQTAIDLANQNEQIYEAREELIRLSMNKDARMAYERIIKAEMDKASLLEAAEERGEQKGIKQGIEIGLAQGEKKWRNEQKIETAKKSILLGASDDFIVATTELSMNEVIELRKQLESSHD